MVDRIVVGCQFNDRGLFLVHRHPDEVLSFMLHKCVVYCVVVGCQSNGHPSHTAVCHNTVHRHRDEVLSFMLQCCVVDCIVVGCQSSDRGWFFNTQASG